jgi:hypothetical protein
LIYDLSCVFVFVSIRSGYEPPKPSWKTTLQTSL